MLTLGLNTQMITSPLLGNEFFKAGNYQSAVNAFTAAVTLDPKMAPLYSNRAAAHMKMNDFHAGAQDCSKAISLLTPPVDANRRSRLIAYSRRAAALSALEDYESAINDIQIAISLDPENTSLAADLATLRDKASKSTSGTTSFATGKSAPPPFRPAKCAREDTCGVHRDPPGVTQTPTTHGGGLVVPLLMLI